MRAHKPPSRAERWLEAVLPRNAASEATLGDLAEEFEEWCERRGRGVAARWYWRQLMVVGGAAVWGRMKRGGDGMRVESLLADVRYAGRSLRRNAGFSMIVVLTLGLGIGVNTAIYSVIHGIMIQALPYDGDDSRLVQLTQPALAEGNADIGFSVQEILEYRERSSTLTDLTEHHSLFFNLVGVGDPMRVLSGVVSANYFETLGVAPLLGRLFRPEDDQHSASPVMVLTYDFWMNKLGGDPQVIGRTLEMNDLIHTVIGVLPPVPLYPEGSEIYIPTSACPFRSGDGWIQNRRLRAMSVFGRMRDAGDLEVLKAELGTVAQGMHAEHPEDYAENRRISTTAIPLRDALVEEARPTFLILFATAGLVLLIATANVANLMFSRLVRRERELTVRAALGAGRARIVRIVTTESALLGVLGGGLGLLLALSSLDLLTDFAAGYTARAREIEINGAVLLFTLMIALGVGLMSGLLPMLAGVGRSRAGLRVAGGTATDDGGKRRLQAGMVVAQVAVSFVLLIGAGLTLRSLGNLYAVDPGFSTSEVLSMEIPASFNRSNDDSQRFYQDLVDGVRRLPTVEAASIVMTFPLDGWGQMATPIQVEGQEVGPEDLPPQADIRTVTTGYFKTMGIPIVQGRTFSEADQLDSAPVAVVNEALASRIFPEQEALGRRISWNGGGTWLTIIGIAADVKHYGMDSEIEMEVYQPAMMMMNSLLVRSGGNPNLLVPPITEIVRGLDPEQPVANVATMGDRRADSLAPARLITSLLGFFAGLAALITAAGIGGVIAFNVTQRSKELGIRIALGSSRSAVVGMLLRQGLRMTAAGVILGGITAVLIGRYLESLLFEVETTDLITWFGVAAAFVAVSTIAVVLPARRVANIDPREVLTSD